MKNSKLRKVLLLACSAVLLVCLSVGATVAYLTDAKTVTNTFTVGQVKITLDEALVNSDGKPVNDKNEVVTDLAAAKRVDENSYKLMPGHTYTKDPTVTVKAKSEESYVRILVTVSNIEKVKDAFPEFVTDDVFLLQHMVSGWDPAVWTCVNATADGKYEFRYKTTVQYSDNDQKLEPLFTAVVIPQDATNEDLATLETSTITIVANAIQADGFANADAAWSEF